MPIDLRRRDQADEPRCVAHGAYCPARPLKVVWPLLERTGLARPAASGPCQLETDAQVRARRDNVAELLERSRRVRAGQDGAA